MKKTILLSIAFLTAMGAGAQETFLNNYAIQTTDVIGSARYVGMGGALGALGADISCTSSNPAALGMFRRSTASITFGGIRQADSNTYGEKQTNFSFDQAGFVIAFPKFGDRGLKYMNFSVNYNKRNSLTHTFGVQNSGEDCSTMLNYVGGVWEAFPQAEMVNPIVDDAIAAGLSGPFEVDYDYYATALNNGNQFRRTISGHTQEYNINLSGNVSDRYFFGFTVGVDVLRYTSDAVYDEFRTDKFDGRELNFAASNSQELRGTGVNLKFGFIARPFQDSPFRVGLAIETPTWYNITYSGKNDFTTHFRPETSYFPRYEYFAYTDGMARYVMDASSLKYTLSTPWHFRVSIGHTFGTSLAVGAEYEYADYSATKMGYPKSGTYYGARWTNSEPDRAMNSQTDKSLSGVHSFKVGAEFKPISGFALRVGYNYYGASCKANAFSDHAIDSYATQFVTATDFMLLGNVNIITFGVGYSANHFFADLAYKYRMQKADFYTYHDYYLAQTANKINLDRHQLSLTLGVKF